MRSNSIVLVFLSTVASIQGNYVPAGNDVKCPHNSSTRLFRTRNSDPKTLEECHELCYNIEGCNYFSIGVSSFVGVCMGCTEEATLSPHVGFEAYELSATREDFPSASPIAASSCLEDGDTFLTTNGCDYDSFVQGLDEFLATVDCGDHDARDVLESMFPDGSSDLLVNTICATAWDQVPTSTFKDVDDRFDDAFMEEYINGDTFLNCECI